MSVFHQIKPNIKLQQMANESNSFFSSLFHNYHANVVLLTSDSSDYLSYRWLRFFVFIVLTSICCYLLQ